MRPIFGLPACLLFLVAYAFGQVNTGELRLRVTDAGGAGLQASVSVVSEANQYALAIDSDDDGKLDLETLPYGNYQVRVEKQGFSAVARTIEVRSALPVSMTLELRVARVSTNISVTETQTLIDPDRPFSKVQIGTKEIERRLTSLPGRSIQDLVNSQPGWSYEGNAVLHPRGTEAQTQFVIDGVPLTDNRSPGSGPEIEADDVSSISIYTAGISAEYGRKMGGVVELNTRKNADTGLHGAAELSGGSYDTAQGYGRVQGGRGKNTLSAAAAGGRTSHYLNPVVPQNYSNAGTTGDFSVRYERDLGESDRLSLNVRHELSRFEIPNELVQQENRQLQTGNNFETLGVIRYQHVFSPDSLGSLYGMVRDTANNLSSNVNSTPILAFLNNDFREGYFKAKFSLHAGRQEWKAGAESDAAFLNEHFSYNITDAAQFDADTPRSSTFQASRPDLEQSAFVEDLVLLGKWTVSAGLRWDHYQLLLNQNAFSPRLAIGRYVPSINAVLHFSYDRVFQTPSFENILISSSNQINVLSGNFLHLPVQPSKGSYYEGGLARGISDRLKIDINVYRRDIRNYPDDDQLLNTGISYPVAFDKAVIYGAEGKLEVVRAGRLTGYVSYSYMVGNAWFPVTGGLFLGNDASAATSQLSGHFPDSQDQRNIARTQFHYQLGSRVQVATGASYQSGLPFQYQGERSTALSEYGAAVIDRINFDRRRVKPSLAINASLSTVLYKKDRVSMRFQLDGDNLNNRLNVIDFGGLFSGNAIAPQRSVAGRLSTSF